MSPSFPPGITAAPNPIRKPPIVVFATSATVTLCGRHRLRRSSGRDRTRDCGRHRQRSHIILQAHRKRQAAVNQIRVCPGGRDRIERASGSADHQYGKAE